MAEYSILLIIVALAAITLFTKRLECSPITVPMLCVLLGVAVYLTTGLPGELKAEDLTILAEVALALVLFTDAAHMKLARLNERKSWPLRMLLIGTLLTFGIGVFMFIPLFPNLPIWQIALIAALLTPTDAALGQSLVSNEKIPQHIRDTLTAESGLNDGLALPLIIFLACAAVGFNHDLNETNWYVFASEQIGYGLAVGILLGSLGGLASYTAIKKGYAIENNTAAFSLALVTMTYFTAHHIGGNSFVAVFASGLCFGRFAKHSADQAKQFLETDGMLIMMITFFLVGAIMVPEGLLLANWQTITAVTLSLFIIRPLATYLSLLGTNTPPRARLFLGWFGPRGLATALFTLMILSEFGDKLEKNTILSVTMIAFVASTFLHGISAHYADKLWGENKDI